jgi:hypothetical protein
MFKTKTIRKSICWLFFLLVLNASFVAVYQPQSKQLAEQQTNQPATTPEQDAEQPTWAEALPFDAVIHVALQCQFLKVVFGLPSSIYFAFFANTHKEKITAQPQWSVLLLSYFQNIFKSAILINAP